MEFELPKFDTFPNAYKAILKKVHDDGTQVNGTHELIHSGFTVENPDDETMFDIIRKPSLRYGIAELIWYWAGSNSLDWISHFSNFWTHLSDDGKTSNSAYGYIIQSKFGFNQLDKIIKELTANKLSRRAVIKINTPRTKEFGDIKDLTDTKDEFCTLTIQFLIRDNKLNMIVNMRSNDLWMGLPYDGPYFVTIMDEVIERLHDVYPSLEKGTYTHFAGSIHIYDRNYDKITDILKEDKPVNQTVDLEGIRHNAVELYNEIKHSFFKDDGTEMNFKEYKDSQLFEKIINGYLL